MTQSQRRTDTLKVQLGRLVSEASGKHNNTQAGLNTVTQSGANTQANANTKSGANTQAVANTLAVVNPGWS